MWPGERGGKERWPQICTVEKKKTSPGLHFPSPRLVDPSGVVVVVVGDILVSCVVLDTVV